MDWIMDYKGYRIEEKKGGVIVEGVRDFSPPHIFECGQCFRWHRQYDGSYTGIVRGRVINVAYKEGILEITNTTPGDFIEIWFDYFDLGRDYSEIKKKLATDDIMKRATGFGYGIRLLKQEFWETLVSFIISANNRIPMIMKVISNLSEIYGREYELNGVKYYTFPTAEKLAGACMEELKTCKGGFRCKYIKAASIMMEEGYAEIDSLSRFSTDEAREKLMKLPGVGNKVADCTLLYSGLKNDVFPTDLWVKRIMGELYFGRQASLSEIQNFAKLRFGELAGVAQQYLFYYARENKIGIG